MFARGMLIGATSVETCADTTWLYRSVAGITCRSLRLRISTCTLPGRIWLVPTTKLENAPIRVAVICDSETRMGDLCCIDRHAGNMRH